MSQGSTPPYLLSTCADPSCTLGMALGSLQLFVGTIFVCNILIELPENAEMIPVRQQQQVQSKFRKAGLRVSVDRGAERLAKQIRTAEKVSFDLRCGEGRGCYLLVSHESFSQSTRKCQAFSHLRKHQTQHQKGARRMYPGCTYYDDIAGCPVKRNDSSSTPIRTLARCPRQRPVPLKYSATAKAAFRDV